MKFYFQGEPEITIYKYKKEIKNFDIFQLLGEYKTELVLFYKTPWNNNEEGSCGKIIK